MRNRFNFAYMGDINPKLYIHDPSQLIVGKDIWRVGQGGVTKVTEPEHLGKVTHLEHAIGSGQIIQPTPNFFIAKLKLGRKLKKAEGYSYLDSHVFPQEYNNWYLSHSLEDAKDIYRELSSRWNAEYEQYRQERLTR